VLVSDHVHGKELTKIHRLTYALILKGFALSILQFVTRSENESLNVALKEMLSIS
jgi:hypothetical protein